MGKRSFIPLVFRPIIAYLAVQLAIAAFVVHPPTLGWIGLLVATVVALVLGGIAVTLFPRMRTNIERRHPHPGLVYRLLVVADSNVEPAELCSAARLRVLGRHAEVRVVAPVVATPLHFLAADEDREHDEAQRRLESVLRALADIGIHAQGVVGADDPLQAVGDALAGFRADEILLVDSLPAARSWLDRDFERQARDLFDLPVSTVFGRRDAELEQPRLAELRDEDSAVVRSA